MSYYNLIQQLKFEKAVEKLKEINEEIRQEDINWLEKAYHGT